MRLLFIMLLTLASNQLMSTATVLVEVIHQENVEITLKDAALGEYLEYQPIFDFPDKTTFGLDDGSFTLLEISVDEEIYYLYTKGSFITIDLVAAKIRSDAFFLFKKKKDFFETNVNGKWLLHLFEIEKYYSAQLQKVDSMIALDNAYGRQNRGVNYWDKKSAKKMYAFLQASHENDQDFKLKYNSPSFIAYSKVIHQLLFQFSGKGIQNSMKIEDQFKKIKEETLPGLYDAIVLQHFFRPATPLVVMESAINTEQAKALDTRIYYGAKNALNLKKKRLKRDNLAQVDWIFGLDVDQALNTFLDKQEFSKPSLVVFWTTFGSAMDYEYYYLRQLYNTYGDSFNFIYVCVNAFEQEEKAKAILRREALNGYHLFPKSADAFWKSEWKSRKINTLPLYILINEKGDLVDGIEIPLDFVGLVGEEMKQITKNKKGS